jgi:LysB family phage lysis regulatory protein
VTLLRQALYGVALLAALVLLVHRHSLERDALKARADAAEGERNTAIATMATLRRTLQAERDAHIRLRRDQDALTRLTEARKRMIKELTREHEAFKAWADVPLPDVARRLHQRPALTGAAAYREWLSRRSALHPEREPAP